MVNGVYSWRRKKSGTIFITHFGFSGPKPFIVEAGELIEFRYYFQGELREFWVEAMETFTDVTKLIESIGLFESVILCHNNDLSQPIRIGSFDEKSTNPQTERCATFRRFRNGLSVARPITIVRSISTTEKEMVHYLVRQHKFPKIKL